MKRVLFLSRSVLCQNLLALLLENYPDKIDHIYESQYDHVIKSVAGKTIHLIIMDANSISETSSPAALDSKYMGKAKRLLIHDRSKKPSDEFIMRFKINQTLAKPFTEEELADIIENTLGETK